MKRIELIGNHILVEPMDEKDDTTAGGIIIPGNAQEGLPVGRVVEVGFGKFEHGKHVPMTVRVDDVIVYAKHAGKDFSLNGVAYKLITEDAVFGRLTIDGKPL